MWVQMLRQVTRPVQCVAGRRDRTEGSSCSETDKIHLRSRNMSKISHVGPSQPMWNPRSYYRLLLRLLDSRYIIQISRECQYKGDEFASIVLV